ncbi:aminotransferase class I/II-fold pyridoxal phosphate-dependent enzyme [Parabacteroides sp. W1-Q-101]|nr:aminotransferase class I/II-fold pyridoxal phosphate-dependent enzyme [Parabacteroides sp. W1-Q-101]MCM0721861.1 aminotransferase class I/II-fold pyridoxal phosphate-dependent enzyme [Parabacteroides sp. W1-Q-101]
MKSEFDNMTLKDFENRGQNLLTRAKQIDDYISYRYKIQHLPYRVISLTGSSARIKVIDPYTNREKEMISFVSNDYLGLSHHPEVINASIRALEQYGAGAGASPLIGGHNYLHEQLEQEIARFLRNEYAISYTSGYAANCSTLLAIMGKEDIAIMDMFTHASVFDGCLCTNTKRFLHNNIDSLSHVLKNTKEYKNRFVIIDGVYSQEGDVAPLDKIYTVCREYNAFLIVDDAHGIGVLGKTGRGIIEDYNLLDKVDMITGTFSKSFGSVGGYAIARKEIITLLRYYSRQNIFSAAATPQAAASAIKAIQLVDKEPKLRNSILENIEYFKNGLEIIGLDYGNTVSAIFPVMVRNEQNVKEASRVLFDQGVYVNPISYPAVPEKLSRLRFSITAMHTQKDLDETLDILDSIKNIYKLCK